MVCRDVHYFMDSLGECNNIVFREMERDLNNVGP